MKRLVIMLVATSLVMLAVPYGRTESVPKTAKTDKLEVAKTAEENGDLARLHKDYLKAAAYYTAAIRNSRQNAVLYNKLGIVELQLGEGGAAHKDFMEAVKYDPRFVPALNNLGAVALMDRKYKAAVGDFKRALALDETVASTHLNLAEAWMGLKQVDRAMTEYARALELDADVMDDSEGGICRSDHDAGAARPHSVHDCQVVYQARQHRRSLGLSGQGQRGALSRSGLCLLRSGLRPALEGPAPGQDRLAVDHPCRFVQCRAPPWEGRRRAALLFWAWALVIPASCIQEAFSG